MVRGIASVIGGYIVWTVIWLASGAGIQAAMPDAFEETGMTSRTGVLLLLLAVSVFASLASGATAGAVARRAPGRHALICSLLLLVTGIGVQASVWNEMPLWYHLPFLVLIVPVNLIGAAMFSRKPAV